MDKYFAANAALSLFAKNYMELKKVLPIRPSEMGVLNIIIETDGPHTPLMLAEMLCVSKPMITAHITSLINKGYITKESCLSDKRAYYIIPTQKARDLVKSAQKDMKCWFDSLTKAMGEEDFNNFVALAGIANSVLEKQS